MTLQTTAETAFLPTEAPAATPRVTGDVIRGERRVRIAPKYGDGVRETTLRYLWAGAPGAPTIIVQGGISATRDVCADAAQATPGWWQSLVGESRAIDLAGCRVLAVDWLDDAALCAPSVSSEDQADALAALLDALGVGHVAGFVGAS